MTPTEPHKSEWSAHNLPQEQASPMVRFSILAVAVALVVIVLASTVQSPIHTTGTKMEPTRFKTTLQQGDTTRTVVLAGTK